MFYPCPSVRLSIPSKKRLCNQLLPQVLRNQSETLHTCCRHTEIGTCLFESKKNHFWQNYNQSATLHSYCRHIEDVHLPFWKGKNHFSQNYSLFKLTNFQVMTYTGWQVCIINFSHSLSAINPKLRKIVADLLKLCTYFFEKENIFFGKITLFSNRNFRVMANTGYSSWGVGDCQR